MSEREGEQNGMLVKAETGDGQKRERMGEIEEAATETASAASTHVGGGGAASFSSCRCC